MSELVPMEMQVTGVTVTGDFGDYKAVLVVDVADKDFGHHLTVRPGDGYKRWYSGYLPKNIDELQALTGWKDGFVGATLSHDEMVVTPVLRDWLKRALEIALELNAKDPIRR